MYNILYEAIELERLPTHYFNCQENLSCEKNKTKVAAIVDVDSVKRYHYFLQQSCAASIINFAMSNWSVCRSIFVVRSLS